MTPLMADRQRLALAQQALVDFHVQCFWFMRLDAELAMGDIPAIARGLRLNRGRQGFLLAAQLCP
jgi:hypothetical protein